jgi:hypothetical protein
LVIAARKKEPASEGGRYKGKKNPRGESFYKLRSKVRGGGEAGSKTKDLAEKSVACDGGLTRRGAEIPTTPGNTKATAPVTTGSAGWQHAMLQSIAAFRP